MPVPTLTAAVALGAVTTAAAGAVLSEAAFLPESQIFGRTLVAGRDPQEVALTFDDGPNDGATEALLELFAKHNVRATFFVIGRFARERAALVRRVAAEGHVVGNHTMTHPWLTTKSASTVREEMRACNQVLEDVLGAPVRFFRPPHGARRPAVMQTARELGLTVVQWNAKGVDWEPIGVDAIVANIRRGMARASRRGRGSNVLLHDGFDRHLGADRMDTVAATQRLVPELLAEGRRLVGVDAWATSSEAGQQEPA